MPGRRSAAPDCPIDAVITWVDGSDPLLAAKRSRYAGSGIPSLSSGAHPTRFASLNEIRYCLLSLFRFAPFVRNVFIITDGQDPCLSDEVERFFPGRASSVKIVDHTEIFNGYERWLPTFNSRSIETMMWRIGELADRFIYLNDDMFLVRPTTPGDWFVDELPVLRGRWVPAPLPRSLYHAMAPWAVRLFSGRRDYQPRPSFHTGQWRAARLLGYRMRYFTNSHTPHVVNRKLLAQFFSTRQQLLEENISYRFRDNRQFTVIALSNHLQLLAGNRNIALPGLLYLKPENREEGYVSKKIRRFENDHSIRFVCTQSLDRCSPTARERLFGWLDEVIGLV